MDGLDENRQEWEWRELHGYPTDDLDDPDDEEEDHDDEYEDDDEDDEENEAWITL